jgi:hypothetical protein
MNLLDGITRTCGYQFVFGCSYRAIRIDHLLPLRSTTVRQAEFTCVAMLTPRQRRALLLAPGAELTHATLTLLEKAASPRPHGLASPQKAVPPASGAELPHSAEDCAALIGGEGWTGPATRKMRKPDDPEEDEEGWPWPRLQGRREDRRP